MVVTNTSSRQAAHSTTGNKHITVEWKRSCSDIPDELFDKCFSDDLEGRWWYQTLERSNLSDQFEFFYGLIKADDEPVGIAPAFVMNLPIDLVVPEEVLPVFQFIGRFNKGAMFQRTLFVGSPCADEGTIGMIPGVPLHKVAHPLHNQVEDLAREERVSMIVYKDLPSSSLMDLRQLADEFGMFFMTSYPGSVVPLTGVGDLQSYMASLGRDHRYNLKKKLKRSKAWYPLKNSVIQNPSEDELKEIFGLFTQTYEKATTRFEKLEIEFFRQVALQPVSWFVLLRDEKTDRLAAFMLCFKLQNRVINKFLGFDYNLGEQSFLYFRLWEEAVAWVTASGASEFQSGQTGYRAKLQIGHELVPLTNLCKNRNPILNHIYKKVADSVSWASLDPQLQEFLLAHAALDRSRPLKT